MELIFFFIMGFFGLILITFSIATMGKSVWNYFFKRNDEDEYGDDGEESSPLFYGDFNQLNTVEGILCHENRKVRTYSNGILSLSDTLSIDIYEGSEIHVFDIYYQGMSMYTKLPAQYNYATKAEHSLIALKEICNHGGCDYTTVRVLESIILDINNLNQLMKTESVVRLNNGNFAFA